MSNHITIGDVSPRVQYTANGATSAFAFPFPIFETSDLEVYANDTLVTSGFTVNGIGDSAGGAVTFDAGKEPGSGVVLTLRRHLTIERQSDFQESGAFRAKVINDELDFLTASIQQVANDAARAIQLVSTDPDAALTLPTFDQRANKVLAFDSSGNVTVSVETLSEIEGAATSATAAALSATNSANSATAASTSETNAAASALAAAAAAASNLYSTIENRTSADSPLAPDIQTDNGTLFVLDTSGGNIVVNLPTIGTGNEGSRLSFIKASAANTVTLNRASTDTINGATTLVLTDDSQFITLVADDNAPDNWIAIGGSTTQAGTGLQKSGETLALADALYKRNALAYAASLTPSFVVAFTQDVTATGDLTLNFPTVMTGQDAGTMQLDITASGADRTVTLGPGLTGQRSSAGLVIPTGKTYRFWIVLDSATAAHVMTEELA